MAVNGMYNYEFRNHINRNLQKGDTRMEMARNIGDNLASAEKKYLDLLSDPDAKPGEIERAKIRFQKTMNVFKAFQEFIQIFFQTAREGIAKLNVR